MGSVSSSPAAVPGRRAAPVWCDWRWAALLGFALMAPAALPAGGADRRSPDLRRRESRREPLISIATTSLRSAPRRQAPVLARFESGEPLRVLRHWLDPEGVRWLRVEVGGPASARPSRGWLAG